MTTVGARLRWFLGAGVLLALLGTGLGVVRNARHPAPPVARTEGRRVEGLRHVRYVGDEQVLRLTVGKAVVRRPKLGVFRVGFVHELVARGVTVELKVRGRDGRGIEPGELGSILAELVGSRAQRDVDLASVTVERADLRLSDDDGEWLELRADSLRGGLTSRGRIVLAGNVEVVSDRGDRLRFAELVFDPRTASFVAATPAAVRDHEAASPMPLRQVLRDLDCSVARIVEREDTGCGAERTAELRAGGGLRGDG